MKKYFCGLIIMMAIVFAVPKTALADAAAPEAFSYGAYIADPNGVQAGDVFVPYGSDIQVDWEVVYNDEYWAIFTWGDYHGLETKLSNVTPKDIDLNYYYEPGYEEKRHTVAATTLYKGPGLAFPIVQTVEPGVELTVTHYSGDLFVRVTGDGIEGWAVDSGSPIGEPTIAKDVDYEAYIFGSDAEICDLYGNGTGEYISTGTKIEVVGVIDTSLPHNNRLEVNNNGSKCFISQYCVGKKAEHPEAFFVTDPSLVKVVEGYDLKPMTGYELQADTLLELYQYYCVDPEHVYYELEPGIFLDYNSYAYYDVDNGLYAYYYVIDDVNELSTPTEIKCYWDIYGTRERSVINAGDTYNERFSAYANEKFYYYAEGYGWFLYDENSDGDSEIIDDIATDNDDTNKDTNISDTSSKHEISKEAGDEGGAVKKFTKTLLLTLIFALVISIASLVAICVLGNKKKDK